MRIVKPAITPVESAVQFQFMGFHQLILVVFLFFGAASLCLSLCGFAVKLGQTNKSPHWILPAFHRPSLAADRARQTCAGFLMRACQVSHNRPREPRDKPMSFARTPFPISPSPSPHLPISPSPSPSLAAAHAHAVAVAVRRGPAPCR
jgi:hypothetical protein